MKCPRCGGQLNERTNRRTGAKFFGCSNYPDCRLTMTPEAYRRFNGQPPQSWEEEQARKRGAGEDRDPDLHADFWEEGDIPCDMTREDI